MNKIKINHKRIILIIATIVLVYFVVPFPFLKDANRTDIQESAIRWLLCHNHSAQQDELEVCFIGIGTDFDTEEDFSWHDPTEEFVARFSDFPIPVFPSSAEDANVGYIADKTGRHGLLFGAGNVRRWSMGLVICHGFYYEGDVSAAGYNIFILRTPFSWVPVWAAKLWIS
ncbi:MAG: hypothetical protein JW806_07945 [Sedimentisphaerales bacterium]|nr:hypothetical protein [Sedimentisphaerales bacterium]